MSPQDNVLRELEEFAGRIPIYPENPPVVINTLFTTTQNQMKLGASSETRIYEGYLVVKLEKKEGDLTRYRIESTDHISPGRNRTQKIFSFTTLQPIWTQHPRWGSRSFVSIPISDLGNEAEARLYLPVTSQ